MASSWDIMFSELKAYKDTFGHCRVPTIYGPSPKLGRWVATQRYKGRIGDLSPDRIKKLDKLGFVWSPGDRVWKQHYQRLLEYKAEHGDCNVPEHWRPDLQLAGWVQRQRIARRKNKLAGERIKLLDEIGFVWAIYKADTAARSKRVRERKDSPWRQPKRRPAQKLYRIRDGVFAQHDGGEVEPDLLRGYRQRNKGDMPPYIPLPSGRVIFHLGDRYAGSKRFPWDGQSDLPGPVMRYVTKHGILPPHD